MPKPQRPKGWLHHSHKQGPPWFRRSRLSFFRWRRHIYANRATSHVYRAIIGALGAAVTLLGLLLVPLPGPGWLIVFLGVAIIASEFAFARRILHTGKQLLARWTHWITHAHWTVSAGVSLMTLCAVSFAVWTTLRIIGLPAWVPESIARLLFLSP